MKKIVLILTIFVVLYKVGPASKPEGYFLFKIIKTINLDQELKEPVTEIIDCTNDQEGNIYILERGANRIIRCDSKLSEIREFNKNKGNGPDDLYEPVFIRFWRNEIYIFMVGRCSVFDQSLNYKKDIPATPFVSSMVMLSDSSYVTDEFVPGTIFFKLIDLKRKSERTLCRYPNINIMKDKKFDMFHYFSGCFKYGGRYVTVSARNGYSVDVYDCSGKKLYRITRRYSPVMLTEDYKKQTLDEIKKKPQVYQFVKDRYFFPKFFPAIRKLWTFDKYVFVMTYKKKGELYRFDCFKKKDYVGSGYIPDFKKIIAVGPYLYIFRFNENDEMILTKMEVDFRT
jgi:hypothetical protein